MSTATRGPGRLIGQGCVSAWIATATCWAVGVAPNWSHAQTQLSRPLQQATAEQIIQQLAPSPATTRSLRNIAPVQRQIDLLVNFDFDSDRLLPDSKPLLESLAQAINSERLRGLRFMVEGHTDAKGSARYNELLSARRAHSVVQFLRSQGVTAERLEAQGRGFNELLNKEQPEAAENRRVRIVALAP